jgi:MarR family transcriptional regulator, 2-MHQ and catechol-resistance regulon repressor
MLNTLPPSGAKLFLVLWKAWHAIEAHDRSSIAATGLARSDFAALEVLLHKGPLPVNTIAKKVLLTSGSMSTAIDRLESRQLVLRTPSDSDGRVTLVALTPMGQSLIEEAFARHAERLNAWAAVLSSDECIQLHGLLKKVGHHAAHLAATQPPAPAHDDHSPEPEQGLAYNLL